MGVFAGRYAGTVDGDFVVFLIGMRINKPWKVHRWLPVFLAMPRMIRELERDPDSGFLGATQGLLGASPTLVQYWRSFEHLERYARDPDAAHLPAWRRFNQRGPGVWRRRDLARDLPGPGGRVRDDLREHAADRPRASRPARAAGLHEHRGPP